ncbi:MAG: formylglycine-generating enzyme family protein [Armatimonadetes bacterium]|nr:formylglycine-generating enzyme family protein [Armatimonadota bacterium]
MSKRIRIAVDFVVALSMVALCGVGYAAISSTTKASPKSPVKPVLALSSTKIEMINIPAGSFLMGTPKSFAATHLENEHPQHSVTLSAYSIGKYEITRGQYREFMKAGGYSTQSYWSTAGWSWKVSNSRTEPSYWTAAQTWTTGQTFTQTDNHPVVGVTYHEAEAFCNWAGGHLPTEAQWERAASWTGTHANIYPWGDVWDAEKCNNYNDHNSAGGGYQRYQTALVGSYPSGASPSGCLNMAGNVWEWCKDRYGDNYYYQSPTSDPQGTTSVGGGFHVLRGAGWYGADSNSRCSYRMGNIPNGSNSFFGIRLVR